MFVWWQEGRGEGGTRRQPDVLLPGKIENLSRTLSSEERERRPSVDRDESRNVPSGRLGLLPELG